MDEVLIVASCPVDKRRVARLDRHREHRDCRKQRDAHAREITRRNGIESHKWQMLRPIAQKRFLFAFLDNRHVTKEEIFRRMAPQIAAIDHSPDSLTPRHRTAPLRGPSTLESGSKTFSPPICGTSFRASRIVLLTVSVCL